jgi:MFS family permease
MNFLYLLASLTHFSQGIASLAGQALYYFMRENKGMSVATIMMISSLTNLPWLLKPLYGFLSDSVKIFGYRRKPYIFINGAICSIMALIIGLTHNVSINLLITFLLLYAIGQAGDNVAVNGLVVEQGVKDNSIGRLQSIQWASLSVATIVTGIVGGWISEHFDYHLAYLIIALFPLSIVVMSFFLKEEKATKVIKSTIHPTKEFFIKLKNKHLILSAVFLFLFWFSPSIGTPLMDKMRNELHFSKIWIGWLNTIGSSFEILGALLYFHYSKKIDMKQWLYYGVIVNALSAFAYLYLTPHTILCYTVLFGASTQFVQLLMLNLMAYACPEGTEATTFALLTSIVNLGMFCSNFVGAKLFTLFGYNGLVIISGVTTLLCLPFIPFLEIRRE